MPKDVYEEYLETHTLDEILEGKKPRPEAQVQPDAHRSENKGIYGVLFSDKTSLLKYLNLDNGKILYLLEPEIPLKVLLATEEEVYYGEVSPDNQTSRVCSLMGRATYKLNNMVHTLLRYNDRLMAAYAYGVIDLSGKEPFYYLSPEEGMRGTMGLSSLHVDPHDNLYALVPTFPTFFHVFKGLEYQLREVSMLEEQVSLGKTSILELHSNYRRPKLMLIPAGTTLGKNKKTYGFSVLECAGKHQWLNQQPLIGVARCDDDWLHDFRLIACTDKTAEIIYSCGPQILQVELGLERKEVKERKVMVDQLHYPAYIVEPVIDIRLHHKLVERGKQNA
ncbi:hypothetical protein HZC30_03850 [Candidatus Woesearchaeota archaeon]|nr:hypothetical protein [Candidatus Woesearchaeota archaeon]